MGNMAKSCWCVGLYTLGYHFSIGFMCLHQCLFVFYLFLYCVLSCWVSGCLGMDHGMENAIIRSLGPIAFNNSFVVFSYYDSVCQK